MVWSISKKIINIFVPNKGIKKYTTSVHSINVLLSIVWLARSWQAIFLFVFSSKCLVEHSSPSLGPKSLSYSPSTKLFQTLTYLTNTHMETIYWILRRCLPFYIRYLFAKSYMLFYLEKTVYSHENFKEEKSLTYRGNAWVRLWHIDMPINPCQ